MILSRFHQSQCTQEPEDVGVAHSIIFWRVLVALQFSNLVRDIQALVSNKLSIQVDSVDADLFETGVLDSMTLVQLILGLEQQYGLELPMHELEIECFSTVARIAGLVAERVPTR